MRHSTIHLKDYYPFLGENSCDPTLTLYLPYNIEAMNRQDQKRPCMFICPGGGYTDCSERESDAVAVRFLPHGYNVFVLRYSCAPNCFPTQIREVAAAMELIHTNADAWNCDVNRIAILGFSAGGHLAGHYTNCYDCPEVREVFPTSKPVQASVLCYPVITADPAYTHHGSMRHLSGHYPRTAEDIVKYSLENHVSDRTPPTFLWHTAADAGVPVMNSLIYAQALTEHKVPYALHIYPHGRHGLSTVDEETCDNLDEKTRCAAYWLDDLMRFLKTNL